MSEWQPIKTAPKDGTRVLLWTGHHASIGHWSNHAKFGGEDERPGWQIFECEMDEWYAVAIEDATHWMPLPEPPNAR